MARINLLPWREELRNKRKREFGIALAISMVAVCVALVGLHFFIENVIQQQAARNAFLKQQIVEVNKVLKEIAELEKTKQQLISRMEIIQQLQQSRPEIVHLFDELVSTLPDGVFLTKVEQQGRALKLRGRAESNARVSTYMRNIESSEWVSKPELQVIENKEKTDTGLSHFELGARQTTTGSEAKGDVKGQGGAK
jgi:type IV pilus assembly protein PilN